MISEFRAVKRPLLLNIAAASPSEKLALKRIMVTSALPSEGKTFCALNLALSLSGEKDYSVLLVDTDVLKPSVFSTLGVPNSQGMMDALVDPTIDVEQLVLPTTVNGLSILSTGSQTDAATELLASSAMAQLIDRLSDAAPNRLIVFDSPPLLVTSEASEIARHMGQIAVVVRNGKTPKSAVTAAMDALQTTEADISLILNRFPEKKRGTYGYGYDYGYGYGGKNS